MRIDPNSYRLNSPWFFWTLLVFLSSLSLNFAWAGSNGAGKGGDLRNYAVLPGFQRFFTSAGADAVQGGRLLLGEMSCVRCHQPTAAQQQYLLNKQGPILNNVGSRVKRSYLWRFLEDPHKTKPGTTMPDVLGGLTKAERKEKIEALVHLLAATGTVRHEPLNYQMVAIGRQLYQKVGCISCHGTHSNSGKSDKMTSTSILMEKLSAKYTIPTLAAFLADPLHSRPSGRMPGILSGTESRAVAHFLLQDIPAPPPNVTFAYYEGNWGNLPDFKSLKPKLSGKATGFDLKLARRRNNYALKFDGFLKIDKPGMYRFHLRSDDGSRLVIGGKTVVNNDGTHAPTNRSGGAALKNGLHDLTLTFFQGPGGAELRAEVEGPGIRRQPLASMVVYTDKKQVVKKTKKGDKDREDFPINPQLVAKGRKVFAALGCANCHQLKSAGKDIVSTATAPPLSKLRKGKGCLDDTITKGTPHFLLSKQHHRAFAAAIKRLQNLPAKKPNAEARIVHTMKSLNCYACHERGKIGGPEEALEKHFGTVQPEMGDEGRIPPPLDGVGAKLKKAYFKQMLDRGANDRPYMHTRMPRFGFANAGHLVEDFAQVDSLPAAKKIKFNTSLLKVRKAARHMVGARGFGCIKCHTFAGQKAEGVQGIDMAIMTERVRPDWFRHYLANPQKFRPGTRMPTSWPNEKSFLDNVLDGRSDTQIEAIWLYLLAGKNASPPRGLNSNLIELIPVKEAIIYRNFIAGAGPRAIGVGYPEEAHLAFDANNMRLVMLWQGAFIDAKRHWTGRGAGYQPPLGGNLLKLATGPTLAVLKVKNQAWPARSSKDLGFKFGGYRLTKDGRPTFLYSFKSIKIEDFPNARADKEKVFLRRSLTLSTDKPAPNLFYRAATGSKIAAEGKGWYKINDKWRVRIQSQTPPQIRSAGNTKELLVPIRFKKNEARIVQDYIW